MEPLFVKKKKKFAWKKIKKMKKRIEIPYCDINSHYSAQSAYDYYISNMAHVYSHKHSYACL